MHVPINCTEAHVPTPRCDHFLTHAHNHITRAVAAMDSCFALVTISYPESSGFWSAGQRQQVLWDNGIRSFFYWSPATQRRSDRRLVDHEIRPIRVHHLRGYSRHGPWKICGEIFYFRRWRCFYWNFNSSLKFLECHILLPVRLSLKVTVLFTFVRSLKRISTASRHDETHLVDLKTSFFSKVLPIILANFDRIPFLFQNLFTHFYPSNRLPVRSRLMEVSCNKKDENRTKRSNNEY